MVLMITSADLSLFIIFKLVQLSGHRFSLKRISGPISHRLTKNVNMFWTDRRLTKTASVVKRQKKVLYVVLNANCTNKNRAFPFLIVIRTAEELHCWRLIWVMWHRYSLYQSQLVFSVANVQNKFVLEVQQHKIIYLSWIKVYMCFILFSIKN